MQPTSTQQAPNTATAQPIAQPATVGEDILRLLSAFSDISFSADQHRYTFADGKQAMSVTTLLNKFTPPFPARQIATAIAKRDGRTAEDVLQEWGVKSVISTARGKLCHSYLEYYFKKHYFDINSKEVKDGVMADIRKSISWNEKSNGYTFTGSYDAMLSEVLRQSNILVSNHIAHFIRDAHASMTPVALELVMGDAELGLAGMADGIFYSRKMGQLLTLDWKFNAGDLFDTDKKGDLNIDGCLIPASNFHKYSLQLGSYNGMLANAGVTSLAPQGFIVHFDVDAPTYKIHQAANCTDIVQYVFAQLRAGRRW